MSVLYQIRVLSSKNKVISVEELYELHTDIFKEITADLPQNKQIFFEAVRDNPNLDQNAISDLEANYELHQAKRLFDYETFLFHQLLSERFPDQYTALPVTEVILEVVSIHPDAGFPVKGRNGRGLGNVNKQLALRMLADVNEIVDGEIQEGTIFHWFDDKVKGSFYHSDLDGCDKIIWEMEILERIIIKPSSKAFWKKHENVWWKETFRDCPKSDHMPYEYRKQRIILPLGWFPEIPFESRIYASVAFW